MRYEFRESVWVPGCAPLPSRTIHQLDSNEHGYLCRSSKRAKSRHEPPGDG